MILTPVIQGKNFAAEKAYHNSKNKIKTWAPICIT